MGAVSAAGLWLDHASLLVPDLPLAAARLHEVLGLRVEPTPGHEATHARIWLHRGYLEVRAGGAFGLGGFFLGYPGSGPQTLAALAAQGVAAREGPRYEGVDGSWEELHLPPVCGTPTPLLVKRVAPPEVAADWPPPLRRSQPGGARTLAAVELCVASREDALAFYRRLAVEPPAPWLQTAERSVLRLGGHGALGLCEGRGATGVCALVLGVDSLEALAARARAGGARVDDKDRWDGRPMLRIALPEAPGVGFGAVALEEAPGASPPAIRSGR